MAKKAKKIAKSTTIAFLAIGFDRNETPAKVKEGKTQVVTI